MTLTDTEISDNLSDYLSDRLIDGPVQVDDIKKHTEGWSRQTISFTASGTNDDFSRRLVARVENETRDDEYDTRNDIEVEFQTMDAVRQSETNAPVPETYWYESDESVLDGRFFIVGHRPGEAPVTWNRSDREKLYDAWDSESRSLPNQFVDAIAEIHSIDVEEVSVLDAPPLDEVVDRELDRQEELYHRSKLKDEPAVREVFRWLRNNKPTVPEKTLVHGDFRIGNTLIEGEELTAVLDWELARIGDPLYDLANDGFASVQEEWDQIEENHENGIIAPNSASAGGDALLIPNGAYTNNWVYRRDLFEQVGVEDLIPPDQNIAEDPLLWDDVLTAAEAISNDKDLGSTGVAVSGHMNSGASQKNWTAGLEGAGGGQFRWKSDAQEEAEIWIDADHHVPSLEFWNQAVEFSPDPSSLDYGTEFELWASDRLAQVPNVNAWPVESTWAAENEQAAFGTDVTLNPIQDESTEPVDFGGISLDGHTVFANSGNPSAMKDMVVQMYETPERAAEKNLLEPLRFITPYPDAIETDTYRNADIMSVGDGHFLYLQEKLTSEIVPHLNSPERPGGATPAAIYAFTQQQGREAMNRLTVQDMTPQRVHELTKEKAEEALAEGKDRTSD